MAKGDVVMVPEGLLAVVEECGEESTRVRIVNSHGAEVIYPSNVELPVVARAADVDRARDELARAVAQAGGAPKEG